MPDGSWQQYRNALFLQRPQIFAKIIQWIIDQDPRKKRVLCLVAPPGSGKTWLLHYLQERLENRDEPYLGKPLLVHWLNARELVDLTQRDREEAINRRMTIRWVESFYGKARSFCRHVPPFDPHLSYTRSIELLVNALCAQCDLPYGPLVLIDGYDEIPPFYREVLSDRVLSPLLIGHACMHAIVAQRDQTGLYHYLLRRQQNILSFMAVEAPIDPFLQLQCIHRTFFPGNGELNRGEFNTWSGRMQYRWVNPFANCFFFIRVLERDASRLADLSFQDLKECIEAIIQRPVDSNQSGADRLRYPELTPDLLDTLIKLSKLAPEFINEDIEATLQISVFDSPLIKRLKDWGIFTTVTGTSRYQLTDFIRALLLDMESLRGEGSRHE